MTDHLEATLQKEVILFSPKNLRCVQNWFHLLSPFFQPLLDYDYDHSQIQLWLQPISEELFPKNSRWSQQEIEIFYAQFLLAWDLARTLKLDWVDFQRFTVSTSMRIQFRMCPGHLPKFPSIQRLDEILSNRLGLSNLNLSEEKYPSFLSTVLARNPIWKGLAYGYRYEEFNTRMLEALPLPTPYRQVNLKVKVILGHSAQKEFLAEKDNQYENLNVTVLIDRGSASASEIVAAALQSHKKATIIGTRSWGKGLVETIYKLSMNSALALTTGKYYTPENKCIQREYSEIDEYYFLFSNQNYDTDTSIVGGVIPDILVKNATYPVIVYNFISKGLFFKFGQELIHSNIQITPAFHASPKILESFKNFLIKNKINFDEKEFAKQTDPFLYEIDREVLAIKYSTEESYKVFIKTDPVIEAARKVLKNQM